MTSIREKFPGFFTSMNQIYNARQSIRREEKEGRTPLQHYLYMATELNYVVWTNLDNERGLPCACYLYMSIGSYSALYLDDIHPFWSTLTHTEVGDDTNKGVRHANADDKEYFQSLVDEVLKSDPAVV